MLEKLFIAKSGQSSGEWLPLWMHLEDTAGIMKKLLKDFVSGSFCVSCGLTQKELYQAAVFLAYVHDIGKATVGFQHKIGLNTPERISVTERFIADAASFFDTSELRKTPHALASEVILRYYKCPDSVAAVAGAHHGVPAESGDLRDQALDQKDMVGYVNYFGYNDNTRPALEEAWEIIIEKALNNAGIDSVDELPILSSKAQLLLSGLLIAADWIASNTENFPLISVDSTGDEKYYPYRIDAAWENIEFPEMWDPIHSIYSDELFKENFDFSPRETQRKMLDIVEKANSPGIFILEAPMGIGKTEAALAAAELLASKNKKNGVFFGLPTQATANGLFPRIVNWAEKQSEEFYHSICLKHGSAELNKVFKNIQEGIPEEESDSGLIVHSWFCDNKKACLADFVVATVDHMLMLALKRKHVMLLHLGLSEKVVVIDEVHAYDAYMNQYLERALQWLGAYHTPVILLSATLPSKRRMSLIRAYLQQKDSDEAFEKNEAYPLLTWTDGGEIKQEALPYAGVHRSAGIKMCCEEEIISVASDAAKAGGCVGIILNTVARAQRISEMVLNEVTDNVLLYHAQYIMPDRNKKESELLERIGRNSSYETRKGFVVIGTQVLEQSLDIDFDVIITDICPMDLLLQRIGRLHRHERGGRPDNVKEPVCYVITDEYEKDNTGSKKIYGEWLLKETLDNLPDEIMLPDDISPLVQKVYNAFDDSEEYAEYNNDIKRSQSSAASYLLKKPKCKDIHGFLERTFDTADDNKAEASVRGGISSVEVLLMQRYADGTIHFIDGTAVSSELTDDECEHIAEQRLRLPSRFGQKWNIDKTVSELEKNGIAEWQKSYLLKGKLVLFVDENNEAELLGYKLRYSYEKGLTCEKESDKNE